MGLIAASNLRKNKNMRNSISLLMIGIASLLLINTVTSSVLNGMIEVFTDITTFDVYTSPNQGHDALEKELYSIPEIKDVYGFFTALGVYAVDRNDEISVVEGIVPEKYLNYIDIEFENGMDSLKELEGGKNILVSSLIQTKMGLSKGDMLTLDMKTGNIDYKVVGFFDTTIYGGNYVLVSEQNLKEDMQMKYYSFMYISSDGYSNEVASQIKEKFPDRFKDVYTIEELIENDQKNNGTVFYLLNALSVLSMLIGIFGIVNNLLVNFMERKRWIAMMRSVGMSKNQLIKTIFIEAAMGGMIGSTIGVLTGLSMILLVPNIMVSMGLVYKIKYSAQTIMAYIISGVLIMLVASILPAIKSSKQSIIEAIKSE